MFLIYIDDLPYHFQGTNFVLYADNTNILIVDKEEEMLQHKITSVMKHLEIWFSINDLIVNIENMRDIISSILKTTAYKTFIMLKNNIIGYKTELKFLGLRVTET